jgi:exopolysaccharide biosynthesis operon protein EpsL
MQSKLQCHAFRACSARYARIVFAVMLACGAKDTLSLGNDNVLVNVNAGVTYDSNLFRITDQLPASAILGPDQEKSDFIYRVGAGLYAKVPYGRQQFEADINVNSNKYQNNSNLDYFGGNARAQWDWRYGNDWNGTLGYNWSTSQQSFEDVAGFRNKNLITRQNLSLDARYALDARWDLLGGTGYTKSDNSADQLRGNNYTEWRVSGGVGYRTPKGNSTGLRLRTSDARFPERQLFATSTVDNAYRESRLSTFFDWRLTGNSKLNGSIGYTRRDHDNLPQRDFQGWTGNIGWLWTVSGRTSVRADLRRDIGGIEDSATTYARTYAASITPSYQLTGKMWVSATAAYRDQEYFGNTGFSTFFVEGRDDKIRSLSANLKYQVTRAGSLTFGATHSSRSSNLRFGDFSDDLVSLTGQLVF